MHNKGWFTIRRRPLRNVRNGSDCARAFSEECLQNSVRVNGTQSRSGAVRLLLFQTKHKTRKIYTMDSSSESEFEEKEMLLFYALYRCSALLATSFYAFPFAIASLCSIAFTFHKQVYSLSLIVSTNFSSLSIWFSIPRSTTVKLTLDPSYVAVSFELYVGLHRNKTQVYSQHSYAGSDRSPAV